MKNGSSNYRRLTKLIDATNALKNDIKPDDGNGKKDAIDLQKEKTQNIVSSIRYDVDSLKTLTNERDVIEVKHTVRQKFKDALDGLKIYGNMLTEYAKKKSKQPHMVERRVKNGMQWIELTNEELINLAENTKGGDVADLVRGADTNTGDARRDKQREKRRQRRQMGGEEGIVLQDMAGGAGQSEKEQQFMIRVQQQRMEEEEMLQMISDAVQELHELALTLNQLLRVSQTLIMEVDDKMDKVQERFDKANSRMTKMLEQSGGMTRWCPILIMAMIVLGCFYYAGNKLL